MIWSTSAATALVLLTVGACGGGNPAPSLGADSVLTYRFNDASVPPQYHRSFELTLQGDPASGGATGRLVVDSSGDVLHDVVVEVDAAHWQATRADLVEVRPTDADEDCSGGTSQELSVASPDGDVRLDARLETCGSSSDEADRLEAAVAPLLAGVDLDRLLATG